MKEDTPMEKRHVVIDMPAPGTESTLTGYQQAILYLNGSQMAERFCVRNVDKWYIDAVADCFPGCNPYLQKRKGAGKLDYWCIKSAKVVKPDLASVSDLYGFTRAFIELQGYLTCYPYMDKHNGRVGTIRKLGIYGAYNDLCFIQPAIPARPRQPRLHKTGTGQTFVLLYQSKKEIFNILEHFSAGTPKKLKKWEDWAKTLR